MDIQQLRTFAAIAEYGSFSAAAARLHLTQSAISKRIALLEEQLEAAVFDRIGRRVVLTEAGTALLPRALAVLHEMETALQAIAELDGDAKGTLSIVTSHYIGLHFLPAHLRAFSRSFPRIRLDLHFHDSEQASAEIAQGRFDLALVTLAPEQDPQVRALRLWEEELHFVVGAGHALAQRKTLQLRDLAAHDAIMPDMSTYTTQLINGLFMKKGLPLRIGTAANHLETVKMLVGVGLGWGVLPERMVDRQTKVLPLKHPPIRRSLGVLVHRHRHLSGAARRFLAQLGVPESSV